MFDISIEQHVLATALDFLEATVGKNSGQNVGQNCLIMKTTGNGSMEMYTTNTVEFTKLEVIISVGGNTKEVSPTVDFKRFAGIIKTIAPNEVITIKASVNDLVISFGLKAQPVKLVGGVNGMLPLPNNQFPVSSGMSIPKWFIKKALSGVCAIVTENVSAPVYNCMRIATVGNNIEVTAIDMTGRRTFVSTGLANGNNPTADVLVEAEKLQKEMKIFDGFNELTMYMDNTMIKIEGSDPVPPTASKSKGMITDVQYYCRRFSNAFPNNIAQSYKQLPAEWCEIEKKELIDSLLRVKAVEDSQSGGVTGFEVTGKAVSISMASTYGDVNDTVNLLNNVSKTFNANIKYAQLLDVLKVIDEDVFLIAPLPAHPINYVVKGQKSNDMMFTISTVATQATP